MEYADANGQCLLIDEVINKGICVACGACVGLCPYFDYFDGKVIVLDNCKSDTWRCLQLCPQADYADTSLDRSIDSEVDTSPIGQFKRILIARSSDNKTRENAQYGGVVSALLIYALEKGLINSAILTDRGNDISPSGLIARNKFDILNCAGSRYTASGGLAALNMAIKNNEERLGIVGLPCQMAALARMKLMSPDAKERSDRISLRIGLFCTWAMDYRKLNEYLGSIGLKGSVKKYDIPPPPSQIFQLLTENGWNEISLGNVRPFIQKGCFLCQDMTAEWADISVGTVEGLEEWNTVIVRSDVGSDFINDAIEDHILEIDNLAEKNLEHLKEASLNKRKRGVLAKREMNKLK